MAMGQRNNYESHFIDFLENKYAHLYSVQPEKKKSDIIHKKAGYSLVITKAKKISRGFTASKMPEISGEEVDKIFEESLNKHCGVLNCQTHSLCQLSKYVRYNPDLLEKWSELVCLGKESNSSFQTNPCEIEEKNTQNDAFEEQSNRLCQSHSNTLERKPSDIEQKNPLNDAGNQEKSDFHKRISQESINPPVILELFNTTENRLQTITGLDDKNILDALVNESLKLNEDKISLKKKIILTLCRLKTNRNFELLAILFGINHKTIISYFADTIKQLSEVFRPLIHWAKNDHNYITKTAFETIAIGTRPQLEVLIGVCPAGLINYVSPMSNVGIEMVTPKKYRYHRGSATHLKRRIEKLKTFKFFSESVEALLVPYIDDIMIVLCGLINNSLLFNENKTLTVF
ncbi:uncharacterized protein LOC129917107 [Episyrphus balteatus]|uniref:uncharacterized protein LOC129917107 n=1 Tax=Episyrphus balteatus TaxID=286459 RepID=UPI002485292E|nr:uncharacterized protein LOC129917107 [Episyrphus balteatus]